MAEQLGQQPLAVLSEDSQRASGQDAQSMNITAGQAVAEAVRTTLGPKGLDKMLVDSTDDIVVTNDGVTILEEMDIEHPTAEMVVEVADTQEDEVGDGTTTAVIVAGELLQQAEDLLGRDIHPTKLTQGYRLAESEAKDILEDLAIEVSADDDLLSHVAATAMTGKGAETARETLSQLVVDAVRSVADGDRVDTGNVNIQTVVGKPTSESELMEGVIVDKDPVHDQMPSAVENANVAVFGDELQVGQTEIDPEVTATSPEELQKFVDEEEEEFREIVDHFVDIGADVVLVDRGINDIAQRFFAREGIMAIRRMSQEDQRAVARLTGARIVSDLDDLTEDDLGYADSVSQRDVAGGTKTVIEGVEDATTVTILLYGGTELAVDESERAIRDAIDVVRVALEDGKVVPGGGAPEIEIALGLRDLAESVDGREQFALEAFADALEAVPRTLAENAGRDPIDSLVELRAEHDAGDSTAGLDAYSSGIVDMTEDGAVEPLRVKTSAIESTTEAAEMILRIDDIVSAGDLKGGEDGVEDAGGPADYSDVGGMGGMM